MASVETMICHAAVPGKFGAPQRTIDGTAFEVIDWAVYHGLTFVPSLPRPEQDRLTHLVFRHLATLPNEHGRAIFTAERADAEPLTKEEIDVFTRRAP